jgi:hypothetical protein
MKRSVIGVVIWIAISLTLACSRQGQKPSDLDFQIHVVNRSPYDVCYAQVAPSDAEDWGVDRLGADEVMRPGNQQSFEVNPGTYKVMLRDCDEIPVMTAVDIASEVTLTVGAEDVVALRLDNRSSVAICDVYLSRSERGEGDRLAGPERIAPGDVRIFYIAPAVYDLKAVDCQHNALVQELGVDLTHDVVTWTLGD